MGQHHRGHCHAHPEPAHGTAHVPGPARRARVPARAAHPWLFRCFRARIEIFRHGLRDLGYVEGRDITLETRFADEQADRLPALAAELVRLQVDVLVTDGEAGIRAAQHATATIPIVMVSAGDPVGAGFVASLAQPGGNITGLSFMLPDVGGKRLELLREAVPTLSRVAVLWNPAMAASTFTFKETQTAAHALGLQLQSLEVGGLTSSTRPLQQ